MYPEATYESLNISIIPEIQRVNISQIILQLKIFGIKNIYDFLFITSPSNIIMKNSLEILLLLNAIDNVSSDIQSDSITLQFIYSFDIYFRIKISQH